MLQKYEKLEEAVAVMLAKHKRLEEVVVTMSEKQETQQETIETLKKMAEARRKPQANINPKELVRVLGHVSVVAKLAEVLKPTLGYTRSSATMRINSLTEKVADQFEVLETSVDALQENYRTLVTGMNGLFGGLVGARPSSASSSADHDEPSSASAATSPSTEFNGGPSSSVRH